MKFLKKIFKPKQLDCPQVLAQLQSYLDQEIDPMTTRLVSEHLELCKMCGLEAHTYEAIKISLGKRDIGIDPQIKANLESFSQSLLEN